MLETLPSRRLDRFALVVFSHLRRTVLYSESNGIAILGV